MNESQAKEIICNAILQAEAKHGVATIYMTIVTALRVLDAATDVIEEASTIS